MSIHVQEEARFMVKRSDFSSRQCMAICSAKTMKVFEEMG
jgi:hypothetical protein